MAGLPCTAAKAVHCTIVLYPNDTIPIVDFMDLHAYCPRYLEDTSKES